MVENQKNKPFSKPEDIPKVISLWSAPRSLSTVLLYSFAQNTNCQYFDEPFLLPYLKAAGNFELEGVEKYFDTDLADREKQYASLFSTDSGKRFHYVKNMAFQWVGMDNLWLDNLTHGFLIRDPQKMVASYLRNCSECCAEDFALDKLWEIYQRAVELGQNPPVIDAVDLLKNPELTLKSLCGIFGMQFEERMLFWEAGPLRGNITLPGTWYDDVLKSTGYKEYDPKGECVVLDARYQSVVDKMQPFYDLLYQRRLTS